MPYKKGESGNPGGRPKTAATLAVALRALLLRRATPGGERNRDLLVAALLTAALNGDMVAMRLIFERIDGKVPDNLELTGKGGGSVVVTHDIGYDEYARVFGRLVSGWLGVAAEDGDPESLDSADSYGTTGRLSDPAGS
jgi:hypothetical protein